MGVCVCVCKLCLLTSLCQSAVVDLKTKEEKDAELDRRIEALRKKNEALVRRYQVSEYTKSPKTFSTFTYLFIFFVSASHNLLWYSMLL